MTVSAGLPQGPGVPDWDPPPSVNERLQAAESEIAGKVDGDATGITDRRPMVWDTATSKLLPFALSPTLSDGATEMYLPYTTPGTGWAAVDAVRPLHLEANYRVTDAATPTQNTYQGITSSINYGLPAGVAPVGTVHSFSGRVIVHANGDAGNEHTPHFALLRYEGGSTGRAWMTDWNLHGAVATQQSLLNGITLFMNNYYNGSPSGSKSGAHWLVTEEDNGGGAAAEHLAAATYPVDVGLGIVGSSGPAGVRAGFTTGIQIGGAGSGWNIAASRIGTGINIADFETFGIHVSGRKAAATGPAIAIASGAGAAVIGDTSLASASALLEVVTASTVDPLVRFRAPGAAVSHSTRWSNGTGSWSAFMSGAADGFITGVAAGDGGISVLTTGKKFVMGGTTNVIAFTRANELGFFNATPITKPTGVAVTAAGIHAALVSLGLIAA
jgi:hypothetical protein